VGDGVPDHHELAPRRQLQPFAPLRGGRRGKGGGRGAPQSGGQGRPRDVPEGAASRHAHGRTSSAVAAIISQGQGQVQRNLARRPIVLPDRISGCVLRATEGTLRTVAMAPVVKIHLPGPLRPYCAGASQLLVASGTIRALLEDLEREHADLYRNLCDETGTL